MNPPAKVQILVGPAAGGKRAAALARYREILRGVARPEDSNGVAETPLPLPRRSANPRAGDPVLGSRRRALWLAPTQAAAADVRDALVQTVDDAFLDPGVRTFSAFAAEVVRDSGLPVRTVSALQRRRLLRTIIDEAAADGVLRYFGPVADSPGFLSLVDDLIADLKHRDVSVDAFQRRSTAAGRRERDVSALYARYEARLSAAKLIDAEGLFHAARAGMLQTPEVGAGLALVVADGFTDFTAAQQEILQVLAERSQEVLVTLVGEKAKGWHLEDHAESDPAGRGELFAKTRATARSLQRPSPADLTWQHPPADPWPALAHVERNLFRNFHDVEPVSPAAAATLSQMHVIAASSAQAEIEEIARQVKQRLVAGAAPSDVVVSFRSTREVADRVRQTFDDFGIPTYLDAPVRLSATPLVRTVLELLQLHAEDWPYRRLLRVIGDRSLVALDSRADVRGAVELCVRHAQLPSGQQALSEQLALWAQEAAAGAEPGTPQAAAGMATDAISRLAGWLDELPAQAGLSGWIAAIERFVQASGLVDAASPAESSQWWSLVLRGLRAAAQIDLWAGAAPVELDVARFAELLATTTADLPSPQSRDATGRVRVLSADAARHSRPRHMLVGGLSEQAFPVRRPPPDAAARADGSEDNDPTAPDEQAPSEMLLFYQLVTRPTESLTLSYPALDAKAQPLPPSPLLTELQRCFGETPLTRTVQSLGYAARQTGAPLSRTDLRRAAVHCAQERQRELLAAMVRSPTAAALGEAIVDGIELVAIRGQRKDFGAFEGMCSSDAMRAALLRKYGPEYLWSPSRLETYAGCPFKFFGEFLLKLAPLPELALENDMARRGSLLHDTLARLYQRLAASEPAAPPPTPETVAEEFQHALASVAGSRPGRGLDAALREIERRQIASWAAQFAQQHDQYRQAWAHLDVPLAATHFEVRFGSKRRRGAPGDEGGLSTDKAFELVIQDERIRFTGQIDRIDVGRVGDTTVFNVIDYKTSHAARLHEEQIAAGKQIQLSLYAMAVAELLLADQQAAGLSAGYWSVRGKGFNMNARSGGPMALGVVANGAVRPADAWLATRDQLLTRIREIVASIRQGWFPVFNDDLQCGRYCPLSTTCRITHVRSLEKQWTPPATTPG